LWDEYRLVARDLAEERLEFLGGVVARRSRTFHHQLRLLDDLCPRIRHQKPISDARDKRQSDARKHDKDQIELNEQLQLSPRRNENVVCIVALHDGEVHRKFGPAKGKDIRIRSRRCWRLRREEPRHVCPRSGLRAFHR
jgi:hypothetical protein